MKRLALVVGLSGLALALPSTAFGGDLVTYGGELDKGGKLSIDVTNDMDGNPIYVNELRWKNAKASCESVHNAKVSGHISYTSPGVSITGNKFHAVAGTKGTSPYVNHSGTFKQHAKKLVGSLQMTLDTTFPDMHHEDCTTKKSDYATKRGAPGPKMNSRAVAKVRVR
jgi:hypothetical protein